MATYQAVRVVQRPDSPPFYLLAAVAADILEWADVPRKKSSYMAGYQRELDDRHEKLSKFISLDPRNIVPGAIIIAADKQRIEIQPKDGEVVEIRISHTERSTEELLKRTLDEFKGRLSKSEAASVEAFLERGDTDTDDDNDEPDDDVTPESYLAHLTAELQMAQDQGLDSIDPARRTAIEEYLNGTAKPGLILDGQH
jgi:hypothetical protein